MTQMVVETLISFFAAGTCHKGGSMVTFIHVEQALTHAGVERVEATFGFLYATGKQFKGPRGLAALLLGAVMSVLVVVANPNSHGGLLLAWLELWGLTFVALALLGDSARSLSLRVTAFWRRAIEHPESS
jgi:hypothetical protein